MTAPDQTWLAVALGPIHVYPEGLGHELDAPCWCNPEPVCADCLSTGPCLCVNRADVIRHRAPA